MENGSLSRVMETPNGSGAAAPASTSASPATSTPSPASSATPSSTPAAAPEASAASSSQPARLSVEDIIAEKIAPAFKADGSDGELDPDYDPQAATAAAQEGSAAEEEQPADAAEVEAKPEASAESAAEADPNDLFADFSLEAPTEFGAKALSAALEADPVAAEALEANPALKASIFANARKAERAAKYDALLGSPEEAQAVVQGHAAFTGIAQTMGAVVEGRPETVQGVIDAMLEQSVQRDEDGNPLKNADGSPRTNGTVGRFFKTWFQGKLDMIGQECAANQDEEGQQAVDILMERAGLRASSSANKEGVSDELQARQAELDRGHAELDERRRREAETDQLASETRVDSQVDTILDRSLASILTKATGLDEFTRSKVELDIRKGLRTAIKASRGYRSEREAIEARPLGTKREKALVELNQRYINTYLPGVARDVLAKAGASVAQKNEQRQKTQAARETAARSDIRSSLSPTKAAPATSNSFKQAEADLTARLGHRPTLEQVIAERMKTGSAALAR